MDELRIVIVDDHPRARAAVNALIETWSGIQVVGTAATGGSALKLLRERTADILVIDINLPDVDGLAFVVSLRAEFPDMRVIAVSIYSDDRLKALDAGAHHFYLKTDAPELLLSAIHSLRTS